MDNLPQLNEQFVEITKELTNTLSQIKGVEGVALTPSLTYLLRVKSEEDRESVEKVGGLLAEQASKYGFELEVVAVTPEEVQEAEQRMAEHISQNTTFKA